MAKVYLAWGRCVRDATLIGVYDTAQQAIEAVIKYAKDDDLIELNMPNAEHQPDYYYWDEDMYYYSVQATKVNEAING